MAINPVINVNESIYSGLVDMIEKVGDDMLTIVARGEMNRKDDRISPLAVINGVYFYVAYKLNEATAYIGKPTIEKITKAVNNLKKDVRLLVMNDEMIFESGSTIEDFQDVDCPMIIATTKDKVNGAGILYCPEILLQIKEKIGPYRILPSSIHELILVPDKQGINVDDLDKMVKDVNASTVDENERLADRSFAISEWF